MGCPTATSIGSFDWNTGVQNKLKAFLLAFAGEETYIQATADPQTANIASDAAHRQYRVTDEIKGTTIAGAGETISTGSLSLAVA